MDFYGCVHSFRVRKMLSDIRHPVHYLFEALPSGRRFRAIGDPRRLGLGTEGLRNPRPVAALNNDMM